MSHVPKAFYRINLTITVVVVAFIVGQQAYKWLWWDREYRTEHFAIRSAESIERTQEVGNVAEVYFSSYRSLLGKSWKFQEEIGPLQINFFGSRQQFRLANWPVGWAEAVYRYPYSNAYYDGTKKWYAWLIHEGIHQLNKEVNGLQLPLWAEEGIASYFSSSMLADAQSSNSTVLNNTLLNNSLSVTTVPRGELPDSRLMLGELDYETYPLWWIDSIGFSGSLEADHEDLKIIKLRHLVTGEGGPSMDSNFNLYYIHWLTLTHFLLHGKQGEYRNRYLCMLQGNGSFSEFEKQIGEYETIEPLWYEHLMKIARREAVVGRVHTDTTELGHMCRQ